VITIADALASNMSLQISQTVSRHRRQKQSLERAGSSQSRRGLGRIRGDEIDYNRARNASRSEKGPNLKNVMELRKNSDLLWFAACLALFQFQ
jgi:hypothetical protein